MKLATPSEARAFLRSGSVNGTLITLAFLSWFTLAYLVPTLRDILVSAPMARVYPASAATPVFVAFGLVGYLLIVLIAIPVRISIIKVFRRLVIWLFWLMLVSFLFGVLIASIGQHHYFPKNGYTECDQLQGAPSVWFTDWVKNPAWCVKGKDRAWVFEQARIAGEGKTPNPETTK
jgi:hypothetical protein